MQQIRLTKTPEIERVLSFLQRKYPVMSEAEIIKMILSERYHEETKTTMENEIQFRKMYAELKAEGKKLGDKLLKQKGLKREDVTEEEFYSIILDPPNAKRHS